MTKQTEQKDKINILIVDDHRIVREGLRSLLKFEPDFLVAGEAVDGVEAVRQAALLKPGVILMDLVMPNKDGIEATREILHSQPECRVLVLTSFVEDDQIYHSIKAGAMGYLLKDSSTHELFEAIRCVSRGESSFDPVVARKLILHINEDKREKSGGDLLTSREVGVVKLVAEGMTNKQIGAELFVSEPTVRFHISNILRKLNLENRAQILLFAVRNNIVRQ